MSPAINISETQADYLNTESSTAQTVQEMCGHILDSANDPLVQSTAIDACAQAGVMSMARKQLANAAWLWCKRNIKFVTDEEQLLKLLGRRDELELLIAPAVMVRMRPRQGDCDCFTMMLCSLLQCLGVPALIQTFKCDQQEPWRWAHVCAAAVLEDGSVISLDASHGEYPGWAVTIEGPFESQLWDMDGNRVGDSMRKGLSGYVREPEWTGNEMTTTRGAVAGPYPSLDVMRAYGERARGLQGISRGKFGMGDCMASGYDEYGDACAYYNPSGGLILNTAGTGAPLSTDLTGVISTSPSGTTVATLPATTPSNAFNWASLVSMLGADATKLTSQALATPGTTILPNGTIVAGTPQGTSAVSSGISSSTLIILACVVGAVLLVGNKK